MAATGLGERNGMLRRRACQHRWLSFVLRPGYSSPKWIFNARRLVAGSYALAQGRSHGSRGTPLSHALSLVNWPPVLPDTDGDFGQPQEPAHESGSASTREPSS